MVSNRRAYRAQIQARLPPEIAGFFSQYDRALDDKDLGIVAALLVRWENEIVPKYGTKAQKYWEMYYGKGKFSDRLAEIKRETAEKRRDMIKPYTDGLAQGVTELVKQVAGPVGVFIAGALTAYVAQKFGIQSPQQTQPQ